MTAKELEAVETVWNLLGVRSCFHKSGKLIAVRTNHDTQK